MPFQHSRRMELKHLRYFIAAVEEGSLQRAARRLHIAQPALSRRVRDLEGELGCALLERGAKGVVPTRAGLSLYRDAISMIDNLGRAVQAARKLGVEQDRGVRLGLAPTISRKFRFVQETLGKFADGQPEAGIGFMRSGSAELTSALRNGDLDMALLYEQRAISPHLEERLIHRERYILAAYPAHRLAANGPIELGELSGERLVWFSRSDLAGSSNPLLQQLRRHGLEPVIGQLVDSPDEQIDLVTAGAGLCLTPASTILSTPPGQLIFRPLPDFSMTLDFTLGWQSEPASPAAAALLEAFRAAIDAHQAEIASGAAEWAWIDGHPLISLGE